MIARFSRSNVSVVLKAGSLVLASNMRRFSVVADTRIPARACVTNILVTLTLGLWPFGRYVWVDVEEGEVAAD